MKKKRKPLLPIGKNGVVRYRTSQKVGQELSLAIESSFASQKKKKRGLEGGGAKLPWQAPEGRSATHILYFELY